MGTAPLTGELTKHICYFEIEMETFATISLLQVVHSKKQKKIKISRHIESYVTYIEY